MIATSWQIGLDKEYKPNLDLPYELKILPLIHEENIMIISDLEHLKSVDNYDKNTGIVGGFSHPSRLPIKHVFIFDREFDQGAFIGRSSGGYLTNYRGETMGIFSFSQASNKTLSY